MMGMGSCCLGRASLRWQIHLVRYGIERRDRVDTDVCHKVFTALEFSKSVQAVGLRRLCWTQLVSVFSVASYYSSEDGVCTRSV